VSLLVTGVFRVPPENLDALRPHMAAVIMASRAEAGCLDYAYSEDLLEPGLIRVVERWTDQAALDTHFAKPHMEAWRAAREQLGFHGRDLVICEAGPGRTL
jgi:quinol monooxygenase YgiN